MHRENEMHRVVRMQRPAHPGAANGEQRWPGLNEKPRRDQRQRHVANIAGPRNATVGREEYPSCAEMVSTSAGIVPIDFKYWQLRA